MAFDNSHQDDRSEDRDINDEETMPTTKASTCSEAGCKVI